MRLTAAGVDVTIDARPIVSGIDLTVEPGELLALIGPNGSGKSTLLRTAYRALRPSAGVVALDDDDVWRMRARDAARRRAVVTQHQTASADFTAAEIVAMGRSPHLRLLEREGRHDRELVADALERVGMTWAARRMFSTLSWGERQRVLLARAVAQQAPLVVLDEPTNHLDVRAQLDLLALVRQLGVTVLAALHDLDQAAAHADRVAVLHQGRLVAVGEPAVVLTPELIEEVFGVRAHVGVHPLTGSPHIAVAAAERTAV
jgi:iron complex transport system ATP-binding protein